MAERYFIFRLVEGTGSRHRRLYLYPGGKWGSRKAKALCGTLHKMKALAKSMKGSFPFLIIERLDKTF
jgi:hypothetical protein